MRADRNWGVPNWLDASAYPSPETTSLLQWRWEFRRRLREYRDDWDRYQASPPGTMLEGCWEKWRMMTLLDPAAPQEESSLHSAFAGPALQVISDVRGEPKTYGGDGNLMNEHRRFYAFDIYEPLAPQLEAAEAYLEGQRLPAGIPSARLHREKWALYLRAMDARDAGETLDHIAAVIFGRDEMPSAAATALKAARKLAIKL